MKKSIATYTPVSLAKLWGCSLDHVRALIEDGELVASNIGRGKQRARYLITDDAAAAFIRRRARNTSKPITKRTKPPIPKTTRQWV